MRQISESYETRSNSTLSKYQNHIKYEAIDFCQNALLMYKFQTQILLVLSEISFKMAVLANKCLIKSWYALQEEVKYHADFK